MDLYLFNTVANALWYVFTALFLLYRFTSFFSYVYNFVCFCGRLWDVVIWTKNHIRNYIRHKRGYTQTSTDEHAPTSALPRQSLWNTVSTWTVGTFNVISTKCKQLFSHAPAPTPQPQVPEQKLDMSFMMEQQFHQLCQEDEGNSSSYFYPRSRFQNVVMQPVTIYPGRDVPGALSSLHEENPFAVDQLFDSDFIQDHIRNYTSFANRLQQEEEQETDSDTDTDSYITTGTASIPIPSLSSTLLNAKSRSYIP